MSVAFIYYKFGIRGIFLINTLNFIFSATIEIFIKYDFNKIEFTDNRILKNIFDVVSFTFNHNYLRNIFITTKALNFIIGPLSSIILPFIILNIYIYKLTSYHFGMIDSEFVIESILEASLIIFKAKSYTIKNLLNLNSLMFVLIGIFSYILMK